MFSNCTQLESFPNAREFTYGFIPLPGTFGSRSFVQLAEAVKIADKGQFTRAGRGLMKHGYREGSIFPKPLGTPDQIKNMGSEF